MHSRRTIVAIQALAAAAFLPGAALAQEPAHIADNSFLIEEAYNQEPGVVQHISGFTRADGGAWRFAFTQEWPMAGRRHQLSYTLLVQRTSSDPQVVGMGDVAVNYRYQAADGDRFALAPRVSLLVPTGSSRKALGAGSPGVQVNLPASWVVVPRVVTHWNAGLTHVPSARDVAGNRAATSGINLGQGTIWMVSRTVNLMLETAWARDQVVAGPDVTAAVETFVVSPGVRFAINRPGGLQIVPGIAVPVGVGPSRGTTSLLLYLSLEHGYRGEPE